MSAPVLVTASEAQAPATARYWVALAAGSVRSGVASPVRLVPQAVLSALILAAFCTLWRLAADDTSWTVQEIAGYLWLVRVWFVGRAGVSSALRASIASGRVLAELLVPRSFVGRLIVDGMGRALGRAAATALVGLVVVVVIGGGPPSLHPATPLFLLLGWLLDAALSVAVSLPGLGGHDVRSIDALWTKGVLILSGVFYPLPLVPAVAAIAWWTPFPVAGYLPAATAVGAVPPTWALAAVWVGWTTAALVAARLVLRRYGGRADHVGA